MKDLTGQRLIRTANDRWGFEPTEEEKSWGRTIGDEFTSGELVMIRGTGNTWYWGRFESDHVPKEHGGWKAEYYVILLDIGFTFYPRPGTVARRPERWECGARVAALKKEGQANG